MEFSAGTYVRLKTDPSRTGVLTDKQRERAGTIFYLVKFPERPSYHAEYELEVISEDNSDIYALLEEGRFGRASDLRRNLSHIQLSGRLANLVYSMDTTNTDFYAYQFKPVLSFLESPSNGLLIADEVGLGKTIEAGLIWTELRARYDARRLVVVCPAMLREKWKSELKKRFGVEAEILDAKELYDALLQNKHEVRDGSAIICSMQGLRPPRGYRDDESKQSPRAILARHLENSSESDPLIDLLIVDEAHNFRNPESSTSRLGGLLREVSQHLVLLSATPVNLREDDLFHLLKLVDPDSFGVQDVFPQVLAANEPLLKARKLALDTTKGIETIKEKLREAQTHSLLQGSLQLKSILDEDISDDQFQNRSERIRFVNKLEKLNLLSHAVSRTRKVEVTEWKVVREPHTEFIELSECERSFYLEVSEVVRKYAASKQVSEGFLLASPQRQVSSCMYAAAKAWQAKADDLEEQLYEDFGAMNSNSSVSPLIENIIDLVLPKFSLEELKTNDSKFNQFSSVLSNYIQKNPLEKIIVFSFFRGTLWYLAERLREIGVANQILMGGMDRPKQDVIDDFRESKAVKVLLSSEVASEGVDLQFCRLIVNYDLPWNPMKIEQRIGRLDRIGQKSEKISIWNLCYANTIDQRIYERLFVRLGIFERALGGMEAILGEKIQELTYDLLCANLSEEQQNLRIENTAMAIERIRNDQDELEKQASHMIAHGGYILEQVHAAHEFKKRITEADIETYIRDYLDKYSQGHILRQIAEKDLLFDIKLPASTAAKFDEYIKKKKVFGLSRLSGGDTIRCQVLNKLASAGPNIEIVNQFHPFVRFISEELKTKNEAFFPLIAVELDGKNHKSVPRGVYAFAVNLWTFTGLRVEEELRARLEKIGSQEAMLGSDESWAVINAVRLFGEDWLSVNNDVDVGVVEKAIDQCHDQLELDYSRASVDKDNENSDRVSFQMESAKRHKERQLATHQKVLQDLIERKKENLIPARKGLIRRVTERFDRQVTTLTNKSKISRSQMDVCCGVIHIK